VFGGLPEENPLARVTRDPRTPTPMLTPHPSRPGSMVAFVALPAFLILLTLVSVPLRIFPVGARHSPPGDDVRGDTDVAGPAQEGPCKPRSRILKTARRAVGPEYRQEAAPQMDVREGTCEVLLWRLPKTPGGYRVVRVDSNGKVVSVRPGM
jgi:hypothetical protein